MIAKCANPACNHTFRYLHEGKLFAIDRHDRSASLGTSESGFLSLPQAMEFYWLCDDCYRRGALVPASAQGRVKSRPKPLIQYRVDASDVPSNALEKEAA